MGRKVAVTYSRLDKLPRYEDAVVAVGLEPVRNPASMEGLDGLMLTGGSDVDPALYGHQQHPEVTDTDPPRDAMEARLLEEAIARDLPVLAICRGLQLFNVVRGGTLIQHLETTATHRVKNANPAEPVHPIRLVPGTTLAAILGPEDLVNVNSRHHQAAGRIGDGLIVSATAPDGVTEGLELPGKRFVVAVQWHPEEVTTDRRLFEAFAAAVQSEHDRQVG